MSSSFLKRRNTLLPIIALVLTSVIAAAALSRGNGLRVVSFLSAGPGGRPATQEKQQPKITWSEPKIVSTVAPGESTFRDVTFVSTHGLTDFTIEPVRGIAGFIRVEPNDFAGVAANQPQQVRLAISIPSGTTPGSYEGTVHVRDGSRTLPQPLKVSLKVWQSLTSPELNLSIKYPPDWATRPEVEAVGFSNVQEPGPPDEVTLATQSFFHVRVLPQANPQLLQVDQWFDQYFSEGFPVEPLARTNIPVDGRPAVRIETSEIGRRVHVYVPVGPDVFVISYGLDAPQFVGEYETMLQSIDFAQ